MHNAYPAHRTGRSTAEALRGGLGATLVRRGAGGQEPIHAMDSSLVFPGWAWKDSTPSGEGTRQARVQEQKGGASVVP